MRVLSIRLTDDEHARAVALQERLIRRIGSGLRVSISGVMRTALFRGFDVLEKEEDTHVMEKLKK